MNENTDGAFLLLPKKYFSRYVLAYEVIPTSLCVKISGKEYIDFLTLKSVMTSGQFDENLVALELSNFPSDDTAFVSFSSLNRVLFPSGSSLSAFFERHYDNFNISELNCNVIDFTDEQEKEFEGDIILPEPVSKIEFTKTKMYEDGITALIHQRLVGKHKESECINEIINHTNGKKTLIKFLLGIDGFGSVDIELASIFCDICLQNGIDAGWDPTSIHEQIINNSSSEIKESLQFQRWTQTVMSVLNGGSVNLKFTDDGVILLRVIILVLLNPTLENLKAIKEQMKEDIGPKVFNISQAFVTLRFGYSFLSSSERGRVNNCRSFIQDFRAGMLNNTLVDLTINSSTVVTNADASTICNGTEEPEAQIALLDPPSFESVNLDASESKDFEVDMHTFNWLIPAEFDVGYDKQFIIRDLKVKTGFEMSLLYNKQKNALSVWVVNLKDEIKSKKYTGTLAKNIIVAQNSLPKGVRFEVNEDGLVIGLPTSWLTPACLKENLEGVMSTLAPLNILQKSNKFCN